MSTRASAPRCASCGMPLAPDAGSCAVCGARVPLIARPAAGDDPVATDDAHRGGTAAHGPAGTPVADAWAATSAAPTGASPAVPPAAPPGPSARSTAPRSTALGSTSRGAELDAATAAREVAEAARSSRSGRPVTATDAVPPIGTRVLAYAVDVVAAAAAAGLGLLAVRLTGGEGAMLPGLLGLAVAVGQVVAEARGGTLGSRLLGLRTVDERTGEVPGIGRALLRQVVLGLGTVVCLVGNWVVAASGAWDSGPRRRGWHDKASGTAVVHASASATRAVAPGGSQSGSGAWTPPRPAATPAAAAPAPSAPEAPAPASLEDFLFAPTSPSGGAPAARQPAAPPVASPPPASPPVAVPAAPVPSAPVHETPGARPAAASGPAVPEPDLLPPPPVAGVGASPVAAPPAPAGTVDDDLAELEHTRVRDPETLRRRTGTLSLHFDTGERVRVVGRGLVGRGPRAEDGQDILHVVALQDAARTLSRVHAEFGPVPATDDADSAIWVTDRNSTNGTVVVDPSGVARVLPAGTRALVGHGWTVRLGDREARVEAD